MQTRHAVLYGEPMHECLAVYSTNVPHQYSHLPACLVLTVPCCAGVILESEELHRKAYNAAFEHFDVQCGKWTADLACRMQQHAEVKMWLPMQLVPQEFKTVRNNSM